MPPDINPATPAIKIAFSVTAEATTPMIKLAVETVPSLARASLLATTDTGDEALLRMQTKITYPMSC